jgi:hypothetical protein
MLSRQVAEEYHSLAVQSILESGPQRFDTSREGIERQQRLNKKPAVASQYEYEQRLEGKTPEQIQAHMGEVAAPDVDPTMAAAGAAGGAFKLAYSAFNKLVPSLAKAVAAGVVSAGTEYPLGTAAGMVAEKYPGLALPFSVATGLLSGATIESALERGILKAAQKAGRKLTDSDKALGLMRIRSTLATEAGSIGEDASRVVNPIERTLPPQKKVERLLELSNKNDPIVNKALGEIDKELGTESKSSFKAPENILSKAQRPSILAKNPWFNVEHVRDSYRFKTVVDDVSQIPQVVEKFIAKTGAEIIKLDVEKLSQPREWGWRIASFDLRMPNGQLVEYYLLVKEMEAAKKAANHALFEKWRNTTESERLSNPQYERDLMKSNSRYQAAWDAFLSREGLDATAADASLKNISAWSESARKKLSFRSSGSGEDLRQEPFSLTTEKALQAAHTRPLEGSTETSLKSSMGSPPDENMITQRRAEIKSAMDELNAELGNQPAGKVLDILRNQRGELRLTGGLSAGSGVPTPKEPPHKVMSKEIPAIVADAGAAPPQFAKYAGNINLERIDSPDAVKAIVDGYATLQAPEFEAARRGVQTWDMTAAESKNYGLDDLLGRKLGQAYNAGQVENARNLLVASATNLKELAVKIRSGTATDLDKFEFVRATNLHYGIQAQVAGAAAEAGRALQIFRKISQVDQIKLSEVKERLAATNSPVTIERMADAIATMRTPAQVSAFVPRALRATTKDMFLEAWINGLLSGPPTHAVNTLSNMLTAMMQIPERLLAAEIGRLNGAAREITEGEVVAQAYGALQGALDGLKLVGRALISGEPSDPMAKVEMRSRRAITAENVRQLPVIQKLAPNALQAGGAAARAVDFLGEAIRMPGRFLTTEDEFFKAMGYRMELHAQAYRKAHIEEGLSGENAARRIQEIMSDPETYAPDVHLAAVDAMRYQTFTNNLNSRMLSAVAGSSNPFLRIVFPFVSTPTNILRYMIERTPFAVTMQHVRADLSAGGARADLALSRIALGSAIAGVCAWMAAAGTITGSGPSDKNRRSQLMNQGWQPDSVKIGDTYYSYSRLEPLGGLMGIAASAAEIMGELGTEDQQTLAAGIAGAFGKYVTSRTWLRGMSDIIQAMDDPDRYGDRYLKKLFGTVVPTGVAQVERVMSPEMKEVTDYIDAIKARTPGWSDTLPRRRNLWGEAIRFEGGIGPDIASPIYTSRAKASPIDKELYEQRIAVSMPRKTQTIQGVPVELTPQQYERFIILMNKTPLSSSGKPLKETLNDMVSRDAYYRSLGGNRDQKENMIRAYVREAQTMAKDSLLSENSTLQQVVRLLQAQKMGEQ